MVRAREIWPVLHEPLGTEPLFVTTGQLRLIEQEIDVAFGAGPGGLAGPARYLVPRTVFG